MALPSGIVTFLFTDIEGSTALARALGVEFPEVLETHRRLIRKAVEERGGHEVDARADELFAAFAETEAAVEAAIDAQRALMEHVWPSGRGPRVRMGIHAGEAAPGEEGYVGLDVNRTARVCAAAVGGQILVSSAARARVGPGSGDFADLGEHRLAGFPDRERIFQVLHEDLPGELVAPAANGSRKEIRCAL